MLNDLTTTTLTSRELMTIGPPEQYLRRMVTVKSGSDLAAGTVIGKETASGKYKAYASGNSDGTQVPRAVLAVDADATNGDVHVYAFVRGNVLTADLTGMDATAKAALSAREFEEWTIF